MSERKINASNINTEDLEKGGYTTDRIKNQSIHIFSWSGVGVIVQDRKTRQPVSILTSNSGYVQAGEVLALLGPSGSGKTTLLNVLAHRSPSKHVETSGRILVDGHQISQQKLQSISSYVEQEDALIGSLTVRETINFAAKLSLPRNLTKQQRLRRVDDLVESFGLQRQANTIVGTPLQKGISGGQKRRLSVASQLVTSPKILFLDEPTSGLDSAASHEVMSYISSVANQSGIIVIASIHQPSSKTFDVFDRVLLLAEGKTCFFGTTQEVPGYFNGIGHSIPLHINPAEYLLDKVNIDFARDSETARRQLEGIQESWIASENSSLTKGKIEAEEQRAGEFALSDTTTTVKRSSSMAPLILLHRKFVKSYRDVLAYGTRAAMYMGLAIMMGTVWLRLDYHQSSIQPFINAIFFGGAFMSFMQVAAIPSVIEDLHAFRKERANGLYGPFAFSIANFLIGVPYLFAIAVIFSIVTYWLSNFHNSADGFWMWTMWLFLDLLAAESLVMLVTSLVPIFVVALAITAFANGLWMSVGGFLVPLGTLNVFWKYVFHYIDYQAYVFQGMMVNQFRDTTYDCERLASGFQCMYASDLAPEGKIRGTAVLQAYNYAWSGRKVGEWIGIMISIIVVYRLLAYTALALRRH